MYTPCSVAVVIFGLFCDFTCAVSADIVSTARAHKDIIVIHHAHRAAVAIEITWVVIVLANNCLFRDQSLDTHSVSNT